MMMMMIAPLIGTHALMAYIFVMSIPYHYFGHYKNRKKESSPNMLVILVVRVFRSYIARLVRGFMLDWVSGKLAWVMMCFSMGLHTLRTHILKIFFGKHQKR